MITDENLPAGWTAQSQRNEYDDLMDREFQRVTYQHASGEASVSIVEVQEPKDFEGWGYQVTAEGRAAGESTTSEKTLGIFEDLDDARTEALAYMADATVS